ncbi:MAG: tyrosine--tRNA ligase [Thermodesulfobacteriota bacterium]
MRNVFEVLTERGFIEQVTDEKAIRECLLRSTTCYIGFDPTAPSLHVGNLVPIMALAHMQRSGHRPIALAGGGTGLVGDPSGKIEMRKVLTREEIDGNLQAMGRQFSQFLDFTEDGALLLNNADWLTRLNYIEFLRDIGVHFSVNRMLSFESIKMGLERGLSFIEFNYQLLQAYDFWHLFKQYDCVLQMGGSDQWGNIVAGIDLIRRLEGKAAFGITFPLIETAEGRKMGKTEQGTIWLDASMTSPYHYYQYWINTDDRDVERFLSLFTFLPMEEIRDVQFLKNAELNMAKEVLAFEATGINHGREQALDAWQSSVSLFGGGNIPSDIFPSSSIPREKAAETVQSIPTTVIDEERLSRGIVAFEIFRETLCASGAEARRLIQQGGAYIEGRKVERFDEPLRAEDFQNGEVILRVGKKKFHRVKVR